MIAFAFGFLAGVAFAGLVFWWVFRDPAFPGGGI